MKTAFVVIVLLSVGCDVKALLGKDDAGPTASTTAAVTASGPPVASASASASAAPVAKNAKPAATTTASAAKKANLPTCKAGEALVSLAASPLRPVCAKTCKTDADCTIEQCLGVIPIDENGQMKTGGPEVKVCDVEYPKPPTCKAGEWLDTEIANAPKCRPLGQCAPNSPGYVWDEQKKKCVYKSKF